MLKREEFSNGVEAIATVYQPKSHQKHGFLPNNTTTDDGNAPSSSHSVFFPVVQNDALTSGFSPIEIKGNNLLYQANGTMSDGRVNDGFQNIRFHLAGAPNLSQDITKRSMIPDFIFESTANRLYDRAWMVKFGIDEELLTVVTSKQKLEYLFTHDAVRVGDTLQLSFYSENKSTVKEGQVGPSYIAVSALLTYILSLLDHSC